MNGKKMSEPGFSWLNDFPGLKNDAIQLYNLEHNLKKSVWTLLVEKSLNLDLAD